MTTCAPRLAAHLPPGRPGGRQDRTSKAPTSQTFDPIPVAASRAAAPLPRRTRTPTNPSACRCTVPIWSSGGTHSRVKQAVVPLAGGQAAPRARVARDRAHRARRLSRRDTRKSRASQALKQALESSATALRATEAGYDVGTRTAVDVLAARQNAGRPRRPRTRAAATTTCSTCCASSRPPASSTARRSKT